MTTKVPAYVVKSKVQVMVFQAFWTKGPGYGEGRDPNEAAQRVSEDAYAVFANIA